MKNTNWDKFFLGIGILTVLSGLYLIFEGEYFLGASGSITGLFLIYLHKMKPPTDT